MARLRQTLDGRYGGPLTHRSYTTPWDTTQYDRTDTDRLLSFSMAKTVTGTLIGIAVREGASRAIDQPAADYVPELAGTEYGATSIRNLLRMASGVAFRETYDGTDDATKLRLMQYTPGGPPPEQGFIKRVRRRWCSA